MPERAKKYKKAPKGFRLSEEGFCLRSCGRIPPGEKENEPVFIGGDNVIIDSPNSRLHGCRVRVLRLARKHESNIAAWSYHYEVLLLSRTKAVLDYFKCICHKPSEDYLMTEEEDSLMHYNGLIMLATKLCAISKTKSNESKI